MKIGIVLYPTFGGSGVVATELGKALAKKGHEIHFITYSQPVRLGRFQENIFYHEVAVSDYPLFEFQPYETTLASKIYDVAKYEPLDILHVHYAIPHASSALMAQQILRSEGITLPFVTTLHGTDITLVGKDPSFVPVVQFCINSSDAVTAVSSSLKDDTHRHFSIQKDIEVIPNFIATDATLPQRNEERRKAYAAADEPILCHISNFRKVKRVEDVIRVFNEVRKKMPCKLLMVGDGPDRYACEQLCRSLHLCDDIVFLGKLRETRQVLELADVFLLPSESESFGLAALEAMAVGVPVISSNTGGIPEVNVDGYSGFLSPVGDIANMAENTLKLLVEKDRSTFRAQAFAQAKKFNVGFVVPLYEEIYSNLVTRTKV
jgi:N-acetyl-alpha-D-glucosaminyl L-malate synthase BshA